MRFRESLTIPAGTKEKEPATKIVRLCHGVITEVEVQFPAGLAGLVHLAIDYREHQVYPLNRDSSFIGDDQIITIEDMCPLTEAPYNVRLRGWAEGATLEHTVYVDMTVTALALAPTIMPVQVPLPEGF